MPITGTSGSDVLIGGPGDDLLEGLEGDDLLDGREGIDTTDGGPGNDIHLVDNYDVVIEREGEGSNDIVVVYVDYYQLTPGAFVETMTTPAADDVSFAAFNGNELANSLYGNAGYNALFGGGGDDYLVGLGGDDELMGGRGSDVMRGGTGDDVYYVDSRFDQVIELSDEGYDTIMFHDADVPLSERYFQLAPGMEVEEIDGGYGVTLIGNEFDNIIRVRGGSFLYDGGGADTLIGGYSGDSFYVSDSRAIIVDWLGRLNPANENLPREPNGRDAMFAPDVQFQDAVFTSVDYTLTTGAAVELLSTYWMYGFDPIDLTGNELDNRLIGNDGANVLDAKGGWNILQGLGGNDVFKFSSVDFAAGDQSHIIDFEQGADKIHLDGALFGLPVGALSADAFRLGTQAGDADDRIVYDSQAGVLYFDPDGNGPAAQAAFARFDLPVEMQSIGDVFVPPTLQASDFLII